ncbi:Uncharacterised protein [Acinetobacter baumannii]|nr:Uncharacterised protein [Acinetobacter baumannii]
MGLTGPGLKFFDSVSPHKSIGSKQSGKSSVPVGVSRLKSGSPASPTWRMALSRASPRPLWRTSCSKSSLRANCGNLRSGRVISIWRGQERPRMRAAGRQRGGSRSSRARKCRSPWGFRVASSSSCAARRWWSRLGSRAKGRAARQSGARLRLQARLGRAEGPRAAGCSRCHRWGRARHRARGRRTWKASAHGPNATC